MIRINELINFLNHIQSLYFQILQLVLHRLAIFYAGHSVTYQRVVLYVDARFFLDIILNPSDPLRELLLRYEHPNIGPTAIFLDGLLRIEDESAIPMLGQVDNLLRLLKLIPEEVEAAILAHATIVIVGISGQVRLDERTGIVYLLDLLVAVNDA